MKLDKRCSLACEIKIKSNVRNWIYSVGKSSFGAYVPIHAYAFSMKRIPYIQRIHTHRETFRDLLHYVYHSCVRLNVRTQTNDTARDCLHSIKCVHARVGAEWGSVSYVMCSYLSTLAHSNTWIAYEISARIHPYTNTLEMHMYSPNVSYSRQSQRNKESGSVQEPRGNIFTLL